MNCSEWRKGKFERATWGLKSGWKRRLNKLPGRKEFISSAGEYTRNKPGVIGVDEVGYDDGGNYQIPNHPQPPLLVSRQWLRRARWFNARGCPTLECARFSKIISGVRNPFRKILRAIQTHYRVLSSSAIIDFSIKSAFILRFDIVEAEISSSREICVSLIN